MRTDLKYFWFITRNNVLISRQNKAQTYIEKGEVVLPVEKTKEMKQMIHTDKSQNK